MKTLIRSAVVGLLAAFAAGCFTVSHSDYPEVAFTSAPAGRTLAVALSGFEATVTTYSAVYGYSSGWRYDGGFYRHGRYRPGGIYPVTYSTTTYVPRTEITSAYVEQAQDALERSGFVVSPRDARFRVEVKFSGPVVTDGDRTAEILWWICTLFTTDYGTQTWSARLKVYDTATNRLVFSHDYVERYKAVVWGPIPLFSPAGSDQTSYNVMQGWTLSALTDRAMADATAYLAAVAAQTEASTEEQTK